MIRTIIVDDEQKSCDVLSKMLKMYCPGVVVTGIANDLEEAKKLIRSEQPEMVFLDIQLPDGNSFLLLDEFKDSFKVIFTTAYSEFALQAFKCAAIDYLLKPINIDELIQAVERYSPRDAGESYKEQYELLRETVRHSANGKPKNLGLATMSEIRFVCIDNIIRLEAANNYTHFYMNGGEKITVSHTLKYYEDLLAEGRFIRVHQSHIINLDRVVKYYRGKAGYLVMDNGDSISISPQKKEDLLKALMGHQ